MIPTTPIGEEVLNAYVDGALSAGEAAAVARAAASDPRVADRIARLHMLKASVAGLGRDPSQRRPDIGEPALTVDGPRTAMPVARVGGMALGAGAFVAAGLVALAIVWQPLLPQDALSPDRAASLPQSGVIPQGLGALIGRHDAWSAQHAGRAADAEAPDWIVALMDATGLQLAYSAAPPPRHGPTGIDAGSAAHFAFVGRNNCQISLFVRHAPDAAPDGGLGLAIDGTLLTGRWQTGDADYILIARQMDRTRFLAIAEAAHELSERAGSVAPDPLLLAGLQQARQRCTA